MTGRDDITSLISLLRHQPGPRKPPSEMEDRIFALLQSIPHLKPNISEQQCRHYAKYLNGIVTMANVNHQRPETQRVGAKRTQAKLEKLSDLAEKMTVEMNSAHRETNELIQAALPEGSSLSQYKRVMNQVFRVLHQADVDASELTAKGKKPSDKFAVEITRGAAEAFSALTGRKATVIVKSAPAGYNGSKAVSGGPFLDFLMVVFEALGVDARPEHYARQLRRNRT